MSLTQAIISQLFWKYSSKWSLEKSVSIKKINELVREIFIESN